jgi:hypothetical protein
MKVLTLSQPFATLVAIGAKKIETRSWSTKYRGPLAIHAAKTIPREYKSLCNWMVEPFASVLKGVLWDSKPVIMNMFGQEIPGTSYQEFKDKLYLGCVIAICELTACIRISDNLDWKMNIFQADDRKDLKYTQAFVKIPPPEPELSFGDYKPGRYAWILTNLKPLEKPIPAKGALSLWEWDDNLS